MSARKAEERKLTVGQAPNEEGGEEEEVLDGATRMEAEEREGAIGAVVFATGLRGVHWKMPKWVSISPVALYGSNCGRGKEYSSLIFLFIVY